MKIKLVQITEKLISLMNNYTEEMNKKDLDKYFKLIDKYNKIYLEIINKEL